MDMGTGNGNRQPARQYTRDLHVDRVRNGPSPKPDEELDHDLTLYWLRTVPGYREVIQARISEEQKRRMARELRMFKDLDLLGREVDGCG